MTHSRDRSKAHKSSAEITHRGRDVRVVATLIARNSPEWIQVNILSTETPKRMAICLGVICGVVEDRWSEVTVHRLPHRAPRRLDSAQFLAATLLCGLEVEGGFRRRVR